MSEGAYSIIAGLAWAFCFLVLVFVFGEDVIDRLRD